MSKSKRKFKPEPTTKKPEVKKLNADQKAAVLETVLISFIKKNTSDNLNEDLSVLMTGTAKVLYNVGMAVHKDRIKAREFMVEVLEGTRQQVQSELDELKKQAAQEQEAKQEGKETEKAAKPKAKRLNSKAKKQEA